MSNYIEEYVQINDIKQYFLHYPAQSDIVILFLHGGPGQSEVQLAYKTGLSQQNYNVVYYDQRGAGKTQSKNKTKSQDITLENLLDDLKATIQFISKRYADSKIILLGHSWGSILGIEYIKRYPNTVSAYIGMGQVVNFLKGEKVGFDYCYEQVKQGGHKGSKKKMNHFKDYPFSINQKNALKMIGLFRSIQMKYKLAGYSGGNAKMLSLFMKSPLFSLSDIPTLLFSMQTNCNLINNLLTYDTCDFTKFNIPVYFICGRNDWQVPSVLVEKYYSDIDAPDKALYWIEDAGHLSDIENPNDYNAALSDICQRL